ncbi:MAG TPA: hypothetical protein VN030_12920 [Cellvibrio sp.]|nr:hypothetical protein [Cellvibrio sp.]
MASFFQVPDDIKVKLQKLTEESDWYSFMGELNLGEAVECDLEDSWPLWQNTTMSLNTELKYLFMGDVKPRLDEGGGPQVGFVSANTVTQIAKIFNDNDRSYFVEILESGGLSAETDIYFYDVLKSFLNDCKHKQKAILLVLV